MAFVLLADAPYLFMVALGDDGAGLLLSGITATGRR